MLRGRSSVMYRKRWALNRMTGLIWGLYRWKEYRHRGGTFRIMGDFGFRSLRYLRGGHRSLPIFLQNLGVRIVVRILRMYRGLQRTFWLTRWLGCSRIWQISGLTVQTVQGAGGPTGGADPSASYVYDHQRATIWRDDQFGTVLAGIRRSSAVQRVE